MFTAPAGASPEQMKAMMEARGGPHGPQPQPSGEQPKPDEKKPGEGEKKEGDKEKKEEVTSVKRPEKPPRVPDPRELVVALDKSGRVPPFNFIGQTWPDVLQWLANISKLQPRLAGTAERLPQSHHATKLPPRRGPRPHQSPPPRSRLHDAGGRRRALRLQDREARSEPRAAHRRR